MSKLKATARGKAGKRGDASVRVLKVKFYRTVAATNRTDSFLLDSLFSKKDSKEPVGPLAGKARA
jgi:hypothetical protein